MQNSLKHKLTSSKRFYKSVNCIPEYRDYSPAKIGLFRYGYGGWVSLDHSCGGTPRPGKANMMKVIGWGHHSGGDGGGIGFWRKGCLMEGMEE